MDFENQFFTHLEEAKAARGLRIKQRLINFKTFYFMPFGISCLVCKPIADLFYSSRTESGQWAIVAWSMVLVMTPFVGRYLRRNREFESQKLFMLEALRKTMTRDA